MVLCPVGEILLMHESVCGGGAMIKGSIKAQEAGFFVFFVSIASFLGCLMCWDGLDPVNPVLSLVDWLR
jgi:hypothetical protein